jgi:hypothetical protein
MCGAQQMRHGKRQGSLGEVAQRRRDALQRPDVADIGDAGRQRDNPLGAPHRGGKAVAARGRSKCRQLCHGHGDHRVRTRGRQCAETGGLAHREIGQKRAVAPNRAQQRCHRLPCRQSSLGAAETGKALHQALRGAHIVGFGPDPGQLELGIVHAREGWA